MPSDSVASFLDLVRASRLCPPDQVEDLLDRPGGDPPTVDGLCDQLLARGALTRYQTDLIRAGRMTELTFAGYPVTGDGSPFPGGIEYPARHPSLRTPVVVRRYRADWIGPVDNAAAFVRRAQAAAPVVHPHLAHLLDAGVDHDEPFAAIEAFPSGDLQTLVADIGPMPAPLAAGYARQAAAALQAAHERGLVHGHVRPECLRVGPLTPMSKTRPDGTPRLRPTGTATVRVFDLGLVPIRPPLEAWAIHPAADAGGLAYLPPERVDASDPTPAGDVYGLGATLFFLLTGRPPFTGSAGEVVTAVRTAAPAPLTALRPDLPADLVAMVTAMMTKMPMARPTAADVAERLARLGVGGAALTPVPTPAAEPIVVDAAPPPPPAAGEPPAPADGARVVVPETTDTGPGEPALGPVEMMDTGNEVKGIMAPEELAPDPAAESGVMPLEVIPLDEPPPASGPAGRWVATPYEGPAAADAAAYHPPAYTAPSADGPAAPAGWPPPGDSGHQGFDPAYDADGPHLHTDAAPHPAGPEPATRGRLLMWLGVGAMFWLLAILGWVYLIAQPGCTQPNPPPNKAKK